MILSKCGISTHKYLCWNDKETIPIFKELIDDWCRVYPIKRYLQISKRENFLKVLSDIFQIISQFLYMYTYSARNHIGPPRSKCCFFLERGIQRKTGGISEVSSDPGVDLFKWNSCEQEQTSASELKM